MADIKKFLTNDLDDNLNRFGCGCTDSNGNGKGKGYGDGYGVGNGYGDGFGYGDGAGYGNDFGNGSGSCRGNGDGFGYGDGYNWRGGIKSVNGVEIHIIDDIPTIITHVHGNIAKGYILKDDMSLRPCYIAKNRTYFTHGDTIREACAELDQKTIADMNTEERIEMFLNHFQDHKKKYPAREFYEWHNKLTGSCTPGRQEFATAHGIDIDTAEYTVQEFIDLTRDAYGGKVIRELEDRLK